jgi:hypothetical protein
MNIIIKYVNAIADWSLCVETGHKCDTIKKLIRLRKVKIIFQG